MKHLKFQLDNEQDPFQSIFEAFLHKKVLPFPKFSLIFELVYPIF